MLGYSDMVKDMGTGIVLVLGTPELKCEGTRFLMNPNDTVWLLRRYECQNCDESLFSVVHKLLLKI